MKGVDTFLTLSRESGSHGAGVLLDAGAMLLAWATTRLGMRAYFLRKRASGKRMGWTKYVSKRLAGRILPINPPEAREAFSDKRIFDERFSDLLRREWLCPEESTDEALGAFLQRHPDAIAKPRRGKGGSDVEAVRPPENAQALSALRERLAKDDMLLEERIRQHPAVAAFHPGSVNTIRMTTFMTEAGPVLLAPLMRIGRGDGLADNFDSGGMLMMLDVDTGRMLSAAMDKKKRWYETHPETNLRFEGFVVPYWREVRALCVQAANRAPEGACVGWDVAITPDGPVLVEGNTWPSFGWQCVDTHGWRKEFLAAYKSALRYQKARIAAKAADK